ncbi:MAG: hypothetical protein WKF59_26685 [Chitinophagaceae bacterium]
MSRFVIDEKEKAEFKNAWIASGVTCVVQNAGEEGNEVKRLLKRLAHFTYTTDRMRDFIRWMIYFTFPPSIMIYTYYSVLPYFSNDNGTIAPLIVSLPIK